MLKKTPFSLFPLLRSEAVEKTAVFLVGALSYFALELFWRGHSHITMFFAGGLCFSWIYAGEKHLQDYRTPTRCVMYAYLITAVEFAFGVVFNLALGWNVWDYSDRALNLWGQVCPLFFFLWIGAAFIAIKAARALRLFFGTHK